MVDRSSHRKKVARGDWVLIAGTIPIHEETDKGESSSIFLLWAMLINLHLLLFNEDSYQKFKYTKILPVMQAALCERRYGRNIVVINIK